MRERVRRAEEAMRTFAESSNEGSVVSLIAIEACLLSLARGDMILKTILSDDNRRGDRERDRRGSSSGGGGRSRRGRWNKRRALLRVGPSISNKTTLHSCPNNLRRREQRSESAEQMRLQSGSVNLTPYC
jgi:hypothetical protein